MSRTYHIWTTGCQMNEADSRRLAQQLEFVGYSPSASAEAADLVVLNTCVVRQQAEDKAVGRLTTLASAKAKRPDMMIGLMGCMVGMKEAPELKQRFPYVDVFMPPSETSPLLDELDRRGLLQAESDTRERALREAVQDEDLPMPALDVGTKVTAHVPVVLGCSHACTFCVIPYRRGAERSRPMADILREVESLANQGVREVMLLGQIVDRYGTDFQDGTDLSLLLRRVAAIDAVKRIRFLTSHPNYMTDAILETVATVDKVCPQIEIAVQAGNNEVLENMRRGYTHEQFRTLIARVRTFVPDAAIHTDIIVGFPGETHEQFLDTVALVRDLEMDKIHISKYSTRPKTIAARKMVDNVSDEEKHERWRVLEDLQVDILRKKNETLRGKVVEVLVEGLDRGKWRGRTTHGKLVFFEDANDRTGQAVKVQIDWTGPFSMLGRPALATSNRSIPILVTT